MTIAGKQGSKGWDRIEILQEKEGSHALESAEIQFYTDSRRPQLSKNVSSCTQCHGSPLKHIWTEYPVWPGVYDSDLRSLKVGSKEWKGYQAYKENRKSHPVYKLFDPYIELPSDGYPDQSEYISFRVREPYIDPSKYDYSEGVHWKYDTPNSFITNKISKSHWARVLELIVGDADFPKFIYALAGAHLGCSDFEDFFPDGLRDLSFSLEETTRRLKQRADSTKRFIKTSIEHFNNEGEINSINERIPYYGRMWYLMERIGLDPETLQTELGQKGFTVPTDTLSYWLRVFEPSNQVTEYDIKHEVLAQIRGSLREIEKATQGTIVSSEMADSKKDNNRAAISSACQYLKAESLKSFLSIEREVTPRPTTFKTFCEDLSGRPDSSGFDNIQRDVGRVTLETLRPVADALVRRCASCHNGARAEFFPFENGLDQNNVEVVRKFLNQLPVRSSMKEQSEDTWADSIVSKLTDGDMPPKGWPDLNKNVDPQYGHSLDRSRRRFLSQYIRLLASSEDRRLEEVSCQSISDSFGFGKSISDQGHMSNDDKKSSGLQAK